MVEPRTLAAFLALLVTVAAAGGGQQRLADQPGYVDLEALGVIDDPDSASLEIFIQRPLLSMVSSAVEEEDSDLARLLGGLEAVRVQSFPLDAERSELIRERSARLVRHLEENGWERIVRVREVDEEVHVHLRMRGDQEISGMMLIAFEYGDSVTFVNVVGSFDPAELGRLGSSLDIEQLEALGAVTAAEGEAEEEQP